MGKSPIDGNGVPEFLKPRLAAVDWAWTTEITIPAPPPWETQITWQNLWQDARRLLVLLASTCDLQTGSVPYLPLDWSDELALSTKLTDECIGILAGLELAFYAADDPSSYAVQYQSPHEAARSLPAH